MTCVNTECVNTEESDMTYDPFPPPEPLPPPPTAPERLPMHQRVSLLQWVTWWSIILAMIVSCVAWMLLSDTEQFLRTGIYFVLIPGTMAAILALIPLNEDRTAFSITRAVTIVVLASSVIVREGFICVLMATPIIAIVVLAIAALMRLVSKSPTALLVPVLLVGFGSEGLTWDVNRDVSATESRIIAASDDDLWAALESPAALPDIEPLLFALPFPEPTEVVGAGVELGDVREVRFDPGGVLELTVVDRGERHVEWDVTSDTTPMSGWMTFHTVRAEWGYTADGTELVIAIDADRELAPGFYFGPLQRWGVAEMADVLADMIEVNLRVAP